MGGLASMYTTKLPWLPSRLNDGEGIFMTSIPEDVRTKLNIYLHVARVNQSDVAESLKEKINKLDDKLYISFADAILKLSEEYWKAAALVSPLCGGARPTLHGENSEEVIKAYGTEFEEISEWFCSVANDAKRICADTTILDMIKETVNRNKEDDKKDEINNDDDIGFGISSNFNSFKRRDVAEDDSMTSSALIDQAHQSFQATSQIALEVVSSVMFRLLFSVTDSIFMNANAHLVWIPMESPAHTSAAGSIKTHDQTKCFSDCLNDILAWLDSRRAYLTPQCFRELVYFSLEKVVVRYLHMLLIALVSGNRQIYVGGDEHDAIQGDAVHIMNRFLMLLEDGSNSENNIFQTQLSTSFPFRLLNFMLSLLGADFIGSSQITETLTAIGVLAKDSPRCAHALCNFATCIISLREDTGKKIEFQKRKSDPKRMSSTGNHGSSESLLSGTSSHHWPSFFSSSKPPPASETVKAQSTHTSAEDNTSSVSTTPSTSTATTQKNTSGSGQTSKSISHFFTFSKKDPTTDLNTSSTAIIDESAIARNKILKGILEKLEQIRVVGDQPGNIDRLSCHGLNLVFSDPSLGVKPKTINDVLFECQPVENLKRSIFGADGMSAKAGDDSGSDSDDETLSTYDIEIHTLSLSNIELGSTKLKPVLHISISGDRETTKTPVGIFDPVTSQYTWRDFALVLPVTATKVNYNSLIFELHYSRGLMPSKLIGSASVPLTGLHITDNIANHSCYIMPNDASKVVATGGNDVGSQYPHLVLNVRKIDSE